MCVPKVVEVRDGGRWVHSLQRGHWAWIDIQLFAYKIGAIEGF